MGPLEITKEMKDAKQERLAKMYDKVNARIKNAVEHGYCSTYFPCDKENDKDIYDEVRAKYEAAGYKIKPTGTIGGVWQLSEDICW